MKITLHLKETDKTILSCIAKNNKLDLTMDMCYMYGQYFKLYNQKLNANKITNTDLILHAHLYDSTNTNNYWLILTNTLEMYDFCIPQNSVNDNDLSNLNDKEKTIIKTIINSTQTK